jgi:signal transduction histidine kinase
VSVIEEKSDLIPVHSLTEWIDEYLLSDVIHKIKNGLGGIGGFATLLDRDIKTNDPRKRFIQRIQDGVVYVNEIAVNLMTLVRDKSIHIDKVRIHYLLKEELRNRIGEDIDWNQKVIIDPEFMSGKVEIQSDQDVVREIIYQSISFVKYLKGNIKTVHVKSIGNNSIQIEFIIHTGKVDFGQKQEDLYEILRNIESVEARLSLAIIIRMVELLKGSVMIHSISHLQKSLIISLLRG